MADAGGAREATGPTRTTYFVHKRIAGVGNGLSFGFNELGELWGVNICMCLQQKDVSVFM